MSQPTVAQLKKALSIRNQLDALEAKRVKLEDRLQAVLVGEKESPAPVKATRKIARKTARKATRKAKKAKQALRPGSQRAYLHEVLATAKKPLTTDEVLQEMFKRGYKTSAKDPKKILGVQLYTADFVESAGRGLFKLADKIAAPAASKATNTKSKRGKRAKRKTKAKSKAQAGAASSPTA